MLKEIEQYLDKKNDLNNSKAMTLSDLHTVGEEEDSEDDEMNPSAFIHNQKEY
jgi:hypothetical protein